MSQKAAAIMSIIVAIWLMAMITYVIVQVFD